MKKQTPDAIDLLDADHLALHGMFEAYRGLVRDGASALQRRALAEEICLELTIHARVEEELFYPALRDALGEEDLLDEAEADHRAERECMARILAGRPEEAVYDETVLALGGRVARHVGLERERMFNRGLAYGLDLQSLARSITLRREELRAVADALREDTLASALA